MLHTYCIMISSSTWLPWCLPVPTFMSHTPVCDLLKSNKCQHFYLRPAFEDLEVITSTLFFSTTMKARNRLYLSLLNERWKLWLVYCSVWPSCSGLRCVTTQTHFFLHVVEITILVGGVAEMAFLTLAENELKLWGSLDLCPVGLERLSCGGGAVLGASQTAGAELRTCTESCSSHLPARDSMGPANLPPCWNFGKGSCVISGGGREVGKVKDQTNDPYGESVGKNWMQFQPSNDS